jgi:hypothetical protein
MTKVTSNGIVHVCMRTYIIFVAAAFTARRTDSMLAAVLTLTVECACARIAAGIRGIEAVASELAVAVWLIFSAAEAPVRV